MEQAEAVESATRKARRLSAEVPWPGDEPHTLPTTLVAAQRSVVLRFGPLACHGASDEPSRQEARGVVLEPIARWTIAPYAAPMTAVLIGM